jgi:hypothetical protein
MDELNGGRDQNQRGKSQQDHGKPISLPNLLHPSTLWKI